MLLLPSPTQTWMSAQEMIPREVRQGWGGLQFDRSVQGKPLQIGDRKFAYGLGTHADSSITFYVSGRCSRMKAFVGVDAEMAAYPKASVIFQVFLDGRKAFDSGVMRAADAARPVDIEVSHAVEVRLVVTDAGDGNYADHADWADLQFLCKPHTETAPWRGPSAAARRLRVRFADDHAGLHALTGGVTFDVGTFLEGARPVAAPVRRGSNVVQDFVCANGRRVRETQSLKRDGDAIGWTVQFEGDAIPFSTPIDTVVSAEKPIRLWMAGSRGSAWQDPLEFWKAKSELYTYGNRFDHPIGLSLPLASLAPEGSKQALLLAMSPQDNLLAMDVATRADGVTFTRTMHRLQKGHPVTFHMHLAAIAPESRAALSWMTAKYPTYFDPPNPAAHKIGGLGAYSGYEGPLDAAKYRAMGFKVNWKASIDFPYMGMFLPPLPADAKWNRFAGGGSGSYGPGDEGRYGQTSMNQLEIYNQRMRAQGFEVLNYFNVTEFGGNITYPPPKPVSRDWRNPERFLFSAFPNAVLKDPAPIWTWGGAVILDCGDPSYRAFLLNQAARHLRYLPSSAGICIDRTDWLDRVNGRADDGNTWSHGVARSLLNSWKSLLDTLGPMMHRAGKAIFVNDLIRRLDIMKQVDGVYDEFGYDGGDLNTTAFLCLRKPHIAWTANEENLKPNPDAYMQRHLYMGAFPTAPVQANDHTILPSPWADAQYLAYGPLFRALAQRKWDLRSQLVRVDGAKANVFEVPGGWAVPVVFGGQSTSVAVRIGPKFGRVAVKAISPGEASWTPLRRASDGSYRVPLKHGCAMLRLTSITHVRT